MSQITISLTYLRKSIFILFFDLERRGFSIEKVKTYNMKSVSILGCGWLGTPLAQCLVELDYVVKGSTRSEEKAKKLTSMGVESFVLTLDELRESGSDLLKSEILVIAVTPKSLAPVDELIHQIERSNIRHVIFISSTSVYFEDEYIITEQSDLKPTPLTKLEEEFRFNDSFTTTILRFGGLFGYDRKPGNFFKEGKKVKNPDGVVNMIHQDDCVAIIERVINTNTWKTTFNACADTHPTRRDFYTKMALDLGKPKPEFDEDSPFSIKDVNSDKLKNTLSYEFKYPDLMDVKE
jgi:nucleoside-diphosphate-sugar epimerase